jgi:hypothetical protein
VDIGEDDPIRWRDDAEPGHYGAIQGSLESVVIGSRWWLSG